MNRDTLRSRLRAESPVVLPSLLMCDFGHLADEVARVEEAGAGALHFDVMDGQFVPNLTYGMTIVEAVRPLSELPIDVHLMIDRPEQFIDDFRAAGADSMTIHAEAVADPRPVLDKIRSSGALAGLAVNPPTSLESVENSLSHCDLLLVMSVMPGFGGQKFDPIALEKLRQLHARTDLDLLLEVDGGVSNETIGPCAEAGAGLFVAGSAIFRSDDYRTAIADLRRRARADAAAR
jgi:ribulose-phosphate 3-epimerase